MYTFVGVMEHRNYAMHGEDPNELLTFKDQNEFQAYSEKRLIELGFDTAVCDALRDMFNRLEEQSSLYIIICYSLNCFMSVKCTLLLISAWMLFIDLE